MVVKIVAPKKLMRCGFLAWFFHYLSTNCSYLEMLLFNLNRSFDVASRGFSFVVSFSEAFALHESNLPLCMREVWVLTSCLSLLNATTDHYGDRQVAHGIEREYCRIRGELYTQSRVKAILHVTPRIKHFGI
ncbi:hypothetical protein L1987_67839 [Smallanthus sonchifolius]|uniref:Uncharacterized protein n=1 Tax=Smallanthus sonchifolius TaxID=185202 RepID=A0ACB9B4P1_9ASTR|nr:hypothetical protein L1987_67839 [Smallanthus sonchifolius]